MHTHAARRRLRPQVEVRLRDRGGAAVAGDRRRAGEGGVDARGRHPSRLLSHRDGRSLRGRARRAATRWSRGVIAARRRPSWRTSCPIRSIRACIELGMGWVDTPFNMPNIRMESGEAAAHTRIGWFRSVNNVMHAWSIQSFVAEVAARARPGPEGLPARDDRAGAHRRSAQAGDDRFWNYGEPYETYPIDTGRLRKVAELAAERAGWGKKLPKGHGLGIAAHRSFVSYIATVVEVAVDEKGNITVPRVDTAIDCGFCVNPERVRSQIEGAAVMGLTLAKYGEITLQERPRRAGQLQRLPDRADRQVAGGDAGAHRRARHRRAAERRRRAGRAAVRAGAVQRDLRRDRQAHPQAADRGEDRLAPRRLSHCHPGRPARADPGCRSMRCHGAVDPGSRFARRG